MNTPRQALVRRLRSWAARRHGLDPLPMSVGRRRIYIVPTRFGLMLAVLIVAMMIAGLNYGSNLALAFAFLMASMAIVTMHHCHQNLLGLMVDTHSEFDSFAQQSAALSFWFDNPSLAGRFDLEIHCGAAAPIIFMLPPKSTQMQVVSLPTPVRGMHRLTQWELRTRYPFGWFRAWVYVHAPLSVFVAPAPHGTRALPIRSRSLGDQDFAGLRLYQPGDSLKQMAWKVLARGREPVVRQYADPPADPEWLDWSALPDLQTEPRLQQLAAWILAREAAGQPYGLRLPHRVVEPARGAAHRRACLRALAAFGEHAP